VLTTEAEIERFFAEMKAEIAAEEDENEEWKRRPLSRLSFALLIIEGVVSRKTP
jgi:hypothetical protein